MIDPRFGRCQFFVVAEVDNGTVKSEKMVPNTGYVQRGGAGIEAARLMGSEKVDVVITGNIGPNAYQVLSSLGIEMYSAAGKGKDSIEDYVNGKLKKL